MYKTAWFKCLVFFLLWMASGCLFYTQWQGWDFWLAFYYTLQTGMSVGFGNPSEDSLCDASDDRIPAGAWHYVKGDGMQYTPISENGRGGCMAGDISKLFSVILILVGSSVIASAIGIIANSLLNPPGGWYKQLIKEEELKHLRQQAAGTEGWADDIAVDIKIFFRKVCSAVHLFSLMRCMPDWTCAREADTYLNVMIRAGCCQGHHSSEPMDRRWCYLRLLQLSAHDVCDGLLLFRYSVSNWGAGRSQVPGRYDGHAQRCAPNSAIVHEANHRQCP